MAKSEAWKRNKLEQTVIRKMGLERPGAAKELSNMPLDALRSLVESLEDIDYSHGGKVSRKKGGTVSRKRGSKIMQGYKAGGKV
jgi:hypothetical protein